MTRLALAMFILFLARSPALAQGVLDVPNRPSAPAGGTAITARMIVDKRVVLTLGSAASAVQPWVNPKAFGAAGNGKALTGACSINSGSASLSCPSGTFVSGDVGKVIAVYGAGPSNGGYRQPLSTAISSVGPSTTVTLAVTASATVTGASTVCIRSAGDCRVVFGTNDTAAIQAAVDSLSGTGGTVLFPAGIFLTNGITMNCATAAQGCPSSRTYGGIAIRGAGTEATVIENWAIVPSVSHCLSGGTPTCSLLELGLAASAASPVDRIAVSDLTLRQILNGTSIEGKAIKSGGTTDVIITRVHFITSSYEALVQGGSDTSSRWLIAENLFDDVGLGGPGHADYLAGANLNGRDWYALNNTFRGSGICLEAGSVRGVFAQNACDSPVSGKCAVLGNSNSGSWDNEVADNLCLGGYISVGNVNGTMDRTRILRNTIIDGYIEIQSGEESNSEPATENDTVVHGTSYVVGNIIEQRTPAGAATYPIIVGGGSSGQRGLETVVVEGNVIRPVALHAGVLCQIESPGDDCAVASGFLDVIAYGGGDKWKPSTSYSLGAHGVPVMDNGRRYTISTAGTSGPTEPRWCITAACTVGDGTAVWTNQGPRPQLIVRNNVVQGPSVARDYPGSVKVQGITDPETIKFSNVVMNYAWHLRCEGAYPCNNPTVPAGMPFGDAQRWGLDRPTRGYFTRGDTVWFRTEPWFDTPTAQASQLSITAVRAGWAGSTWIQSTAHAYADRAVPTVDNGHVYTQTVLAGCTSHASTEPPWPTSPGGAVSDGTCTWKEAGAAVLWDDVQEIAMAGDATITPLTKVMRITCANGAGCQATISGASAVDLQRVVILNIGSNTVTVVHGSGSVQLATGASTPLPQWRALTLLYTKDRWTQVEGLPQDLAATAMSGFDGRAITATTFSNLGTPPNGRVYYCIDCAIATPCAGSGTGAIAKRLDGVWVCSERASSGSRRP